MHFIILHGMYTYVLKKLYKHKINYAFWAIIKHVVIYAIGLYRLRLNADYCSEQLVHNSIS